MIVACLTGVTVDSADATYNVEFTTAERDWLEDHPVIIVGYDPGWPPYEYRDANGKLSGVSAALAEKFSEISGSQFYQADSIMTWQDSIDALRAGNVDVLFSVERTPEREEYMDFTSTWQTISIDIITQDSQRHVINASNLVDYRVVVVQGYAVVSWLDENLPNVNYTTVSSTLEALHMVSDGRADAYLEPWAVAHYLALQNDISGLANAGPLGDTYALSIGYEKASPLGSILQKMLDALGDEQESLVQDAIDRSNSALAMLPFDTQEEQWLESHPVITFGYDPEWLGVSESVAKRLSEISGSQFVAFEPIHSWQDALDGVRNGHIDTILAIERNAEREEYMDFTSAWHVIPVNIITRDSQVGEIHRSNLDNYRVIVVQGYAVESWLATYMPNLSYVAVANTIEALQMISDGRADAYLEPWDMAGYIAEQIGIEGVANAGLLGDEYALAMGHTQGDTILGSILQKMVNEIHDEKDQLIADGLFPDATSSTVNHICR